MQGPKEIIFRVDIVGSLEGCLGLVCVKEAERAENHCVSRVDAAA